MRHRQFWERVFIKGLILNFNTRSVSFYLSTDILINLIIKLSYSAVKLFSKYSNICRRLYRKTGTAEEKKIITSVIGDR